MRIPTHPRLLSILLVTFLGVAATPGGAAGQDPDSARAVLGREGLCPGPQVQISTTFGDRFRGRCVLQDQRLLVVGEGVEQPVLYTAVDSVWMRWPGTRSGTVAGGWVGAGLGGALAAAYRTVACDFRCPASSVLYGLGGVVAGALTGREVGALIGSRTQIWLRLYPH